jgi:flagellar basal body rod protein FlgC
MSDPLNVAASGLQVAAAAFEASAVRVARAGTELQTARTAGPDAALDRPTPESAGSPPPPSPPPPPDGARAAADHDRMLAALSGTDLARETANQLAAAAAFRANLATLRTAQEMTQSLLDVVA